MAWCGQEARGEAVEISGNLGGERGVSQPRPRLPGGLARREAPAAPLAGRQELF